MKFTCLLLFTMLSSSVQSEDFVYDTRNFRVTANSLELAAEVATTAERCREEIAVVWLGKKLPRWSAPCPIKVKVGTIGAGGSTTFTFENGEVFGWNMKVQGTRERILDSVIPHEVSHTIFACHFRRPLPRWFDEGAATIVECSAETNRQDQILAQCFKDDREVPLRTLFEVTEYPEAMEDVLTLYAEGYSVTAFLIERGSHEKYLELYSKRLTLGWDKALHEVYGFKTVEALEKDWRVWADNKLLAAK